MSKNLTKSFLSLLRSIESKPFTEQVISQVRRCTLDYLGATLSGIPVLYKHNSALLEQLGYSEHGCSIIGLDKKSSAETAALINGLHSHVTEMDDGTRFGMVHPGAPIFSALFPVAEQYKVDGCDFIRGVVVGYEAALRLANSMQPSHYKKGYHPTATCGSIGAALGIASMLGYSPEETEAVLGAVAISAAGSLKVVDKGSMLKPFNVGRASAIAIQSAFLARAGYSSPYDVLSGEAGFFSIMCDSVDENVLLGDARNKYWINSIYFKPYAACRHSHPAIEAALHIRNNVNFDLSKIDEIKLFTYEGLEGRHDASEAKSISSAKMSIPFSVAIALVTGNAGIEQFTDAELSNDVIISLAEKFKLVGLEGYTKLIPEQRSGELKVVLENGDSFSKKITYPKGEPENPLSDFELTEKFSKLALYGGFELPYSNNLKNCVKNLPNSFGKLCLSFNNIS